MVLELCDPLVNTRTHEARIDPFLDFNGAVIATLACVGCGFFEAGSKVHKPWKRDCGWYQDA